MLVRCFLLCLDLNESLMFMVLDLGLSLETTVLDLESLVLDLNVPVLGLVLLSYCHL